MMNNVGVHMVFAIICNLISSASKAKVVALYLNEKYGVIISNPLE